MNTKEKLPYFRVDDTGRAAYYLQGQDFLKRLTGGRSNLIGGTTFTSLSELFGQATAQPEILIFSENGRQNADIGDESAISNLTDPVLRRASQYQDFATLTREWRNLGVGDLRALYYWQLLTSDGQHNADILRIGGFPRSPYAHNARNRDSSWQSFRVQGDLGPDARSWLIHDLYLGDALRTLGIEWVEIEDVVSEAFIRSLPRAYRKLLKTSQVPRALYYVLFAHDLGRWWSLQPRPRVARNQNEVTLAAATIAADTVTRFLSQVPVASLQNAGLNGLPDLLTRFQQFGSMPRSIRDTWDSASLEDFLAFAGKRSPAQGGFYGVLADTIAGHLGKQSLRQAPPVEAPEFIRKVFQSLAGKGGKTGRQSAHFRRLLADIVHHLPAPRFVQLQFDQNSTELLPGLNEEASRGILRRKGKA